jgi:hypothetical protein
MQTSKMMTHIDHRIGRNDYLQWVSENDSYPTHSHLYIITSYVGSPKRFYRNFGPFNSQEEAMSWMREYVKKYTTKGFITEYRTMPVCEALLFGCGEIPSAIIDPMVPNTTNQPISHDNPN